jgi:hypothetical protein
MSLAPVRAEATAESVANRWSGAMLARSVVIDVAHLGA